MSRNQPPAGRPTFFSEHLDLSRLSMEVWIEEVKHRVRPSSPGNPPWGEASPFGVGREDGRTAIPLGKAFSPCDHPRCRPAAMPQPGTERYVFSSPNFPSILTVDQSSCCSYAPPRAMTYRSAVLLFIILVLLVVKEIVTRVVFLVLFRRDSATIFEPFTFKGQRGRPTRVSEGGSTRVKRTMPFDQCQAQALPTTAAGA